MGIGGDLLGKETDAFARHAVPARLRLVVNHARLTEFPKKESKSHHEEAYWQYNFKNTSKKRSKDVWGVIDPPFRGTLSREAAVVRASRQSAKSLWHSIIKCTPMRC